MSAQDRAGRGRPETAPEPSGGAGVRHVVFACRSTSQAGGITTVVDELAAEFVRRGLTVSYLSIHPPAGEPRVPGPVFEVDRLRHWTADHPLAADYPGPLGAKLAVKTALTPLWRRWRIRRLRRYLARLGRDTAIIFANPDMLTCLSEAGYVRPEADAPFLVAHVHTSPEGLERMGWDVPFPALDVVDAVVALHPSYMQPIADTQGVPVGAIPNPSGTVPAAAPREDADGRRRIVSFGRLSAEKRVDLTIRAFDALAADVPDVVLEVWAPGTRRSPWPAWPTRRLTGTASASAAGPTTQRPCSLARRFTSWSPTSRASQCPQSRRCAAASRLLAGQCPPDCRTSFINVVSHSPAPIPPRSRTPSRPSWTARTGSPGWSRPAGASARTSSPRSSRTCGSTSSPRATSPPSTTPAPARQPRHLER